MCLLWFYDHVQEKIDVATYEKSVAGGDMKLIIKLMWPYYQFLRGCTKG